MEPQPNESLFRFQIAAFGPGICRNASRVNFVVIRKALHQVAFDRLQPGETRLLELMLWNRVCLVQLERRRSAGGVDGHEPSDETDVDGLLERPGWARACAWGDGVIERPGRNKNEERGQTPEYVDRLQGLGVCQRIFGVHR